MTKWSDSADIIRIVVSFLKYEQILSFFIKYNVDYRIKIKYDGSKSDVNINDIKKLSCCVGLEIVGVHYSIHLDNKRVSHYDYLNNIGKAHINKIKKIKFTGSFLQSTTIDLSIVNVCKNLVSLSVSNSNLINIIGLKQNKKLRYVDLSGSSSSTRDFACFPSIRYLKIPHCEIIDLNDLSKCDGLRVLHICGYDMIENVLKCSRLKKLVWNFSMFHECKDKVIIECMRLKKIIFNNYARKICIVPNVSLCEKLVHVVFNNLMLCDFEGLRGCVSLRKIVLNNCTGINDFSALGSCEGLEDVVISECDLDNINWMRLCKNVRRFSIYKCWNLENIDGLGECGVEEFGIERCGKIKSLDVLVNLRRVRGIIVRKCSGIVSIDYLSKCVGLEVLYVKECNGLSKVLWKGTFVESKLRKFIIVKCKKLSSVGGFEGFEGVEGFELVVRGCCMCVLSRNKKKC